MNCDFCFDPDPAWTFPCQSYVDPDLQAESVGDWLACDPCANLICQGDYEGLLDRSPKNPTMLVLIELAGYKIARESIRRMHQRFASHRTGEPIPVLRTH